MSRNKYETLKVLEYAGLPVPSFIAVSSVDDERLHSLSAIFGENCTYAVRSSASGEDGSERSFAGQYQTLLNIAEADVADAVKHVFASYDRDIAYDDAVLGSRKSCVVIIQAMVDAVFSGIAFTSNPEGFIGEKVVVIGRGIGENVVSDAVDVKTWHAAGETMWAFGHIEDEERVSSEQIHEILELLARSQSILDCEIDMEFAIDADGRVHVLQARPITMIAGMPCSEAIEKAVLLDNSNIVESYPGVSLPLTQSFVQAVYERIFRSSVLRLTGRQDIVADMSKYLQHMVGFCDWHAYYCMESWYAVLSLLPFSKRIKRIWRKSLGVVETGSQEDVKFGFRTKACVVSHVLRYWKHIPRLTEEACVDVEPYLDKVEHALSEVNSIYTLLSMYDDMFEHVLSMWDITLWNDMYAFLNAAFSGDDFTAQGTLASMAPLDAISSLIHVAKHDGLDADTYIEARNKFIAEFGNRVVGELKLETRTWKTNSELLDAYVKANLNTDVKLVTTDDVVSEHRGLRHRLFAKKARKGVELRERSRLLRSRMFGIAREIFLRIGQIWTSEGVLEGARDIFYLDIGTIREFATGNSCNLMHNVSVAKQFEQRVATLPVVPKVFAVGEAPWLHTLPSDSSLMDKRTRLVAGDVLFGTGTSTGTVRGEVIKLDVANALEKSSDVAGKIVVTVSTDPGWAFVLRSAAGIVAERGSLLSHTSIIARELHVPAVVGISGVFHALQDGDVVEVDGNTGTVTVGV